MKDLRFKTSFDVWKQWMKANTNCLFLDLKLPLRYGNLVLLCLTLYGKFDLKLPLRYGNLLLLICCSLRDSDLKLPLRYGNI